MKKGKIFGKRQIVTAALVLCLAAAVWLNMKYSSFDISASSDTPTDLGGTQYLNNNSILGEAVQTSGGVSYINTAKNERNSNRKKTIEELTSIVNNSTAEADAKNNALKNISFIGECIEKESAIETIIKAKGFDDVLTIISDESVTVIVPKESLLTSESLQIQDAVMSQIKIDLEKIKIITVK